MARLENPQPRSRLGIFGGTFDPPHIGHLILASEAFFQLHLDRVLWVLTPAPPHKRGRSVSHLDMRIEMLVAALQGDPFFELSRVDIDRPPPHFAADSLKILKRQFPGSELVYLMGADSLVLLPTWHDPKAFVEVVDEIGVMNRPGWEPILDELERSLPSISRKVRKLDVPQMDISSSHLRSAVHAGAAFRYYLPAPVYDLICTRGYYRSDNSCGDQTVNVSLSKNCG